jgi:peptidyl-prolyl cis-trans isomerase SDCCAG10
MCSGGESIYEKPFADEFHSRLRFSHRGIVAMANTGRDTNQSQFFITLDKAPELQHKNTIFGKVAGDTFFNVLRINEFEVDEHERPLFPPKIIRVDVVWNPFDDIVPRMLSRKSEAPAIKVEEQKPVKYVIFDATARFHF